MNSLKHRKARFYLLWSAKALRKKSCCGQWRCSKFRSLIFCASCSQTGGCHCSLSGCFDHASGPSSWVQLMSLLIEFPRENWGTRFWYCWWKKSCTTWDVWNTWIPVNTCKWLGYLFLPSTVSWLFLPAIADFRHKKAISLLCIHIWF